MSPFPEYDVQLEEIHHIHKLDAPSGTAITLAEGVIGNSGFESWKLEETKGKELGIFAIQKMKFRVHIVYITVRKWMKLRSSIQLSTEMALL